MESVVTLIAAPGGGLDAGIVAEAATRLKALGYYEGEIDGNFGSGSRAAIEAFQSRLGLTKDGNPSQKVLQAIRGH